MTAQGTGQVLLDRCRLLVLHPALQAEVLRMAMAQLWGEGQGLGSYHIEAVLRHAAASQSGCVIELPRGWAAVIEPQVVRLGRVEKQQQPAPPRTLVIPGTVEWGGWQIIAALHPTLDAAGQRAKDSLSAAMDWSTIKPPLQVRARSPGDRIDSIGIKGHQKIQDILVDAKVPRPQREGVPIVADQDGIIWVAGYRQSRRTMPKEISSQILKLTAHRVR